MFSGNTRHRVEVQCLKDFDDRHFVLPSAVCQGLRAGGHRLDAPIRHLTKRLLDQPSERRLLIIIGDGLISDEGYEGRYAWADVAHAAEEAEEAADLRLLHRRRTGASTRCRKCSARRSPAASATSTTYPKSWLHIHRELVSE